MKRAGSPRVSNQRAQKIVNNINNIHNYFNCAPKPEIKEVATQCEPCAQSDDPPPPMRLLDSKGERKSYEKQWKEPGKNRQGRWVYKWQLQNDGQLRAGCFHTCKNSWVSMERFAPDAEAEKTAGASQRFHSALAAFRVAHQVGDEAVCQAQLAIVLQLRAQRCDSCREHSNKRSPTEQACKDEWARMRQEACQRQNGCANQACPERGMVSWIALQADHGTNDKVHDLGDYMWWSYRGGVQAMREEYDERIFQFVCGVCHALESTSNSGRRKTSTTPERRAEEADDQYNDRCCRARTKVPKYEFVDELKIQVGYCQYPGCGRVCTLDNAVGFHWDHRVHSTKRACRCPEKNPVTGKAQGCQDCPDRIFRRHGGVAGLAGNHSKETAFHCIPRGETLTTGELLEAEAAKCDLLCTPCHLSRKPQGRARHDASVSIAETD